MKNLKSGILACALLFGASSSMYAQQAEAAQTQEIKTNEVKAESVKVIDQDAKKQEVTMKELPASVVENIKTNYAEAKFVSAVKHLGADGEAKAYEVVLNQGGKEMTLKYDAKGMPAKK
ncbi:hypothetical protein [Owenweeksia hongkongensis]|uniref:hypothetical protein n=1 Tax=Owenweeksia hongkongensis TaxID=253245 RepID=UPI003A95D044